MEVPDGKGILGRGQTAQLKLAFIHSFIHFFIATNVKTHSPLHMTKTYYNYVTR